MRLETEPKIDKGSTISTKAKIFRMIITTIISPLTQAAVGGEHYLVRTEKLLEDGYGLVVLFNHFSKRDPFQVLKTVLLKNPSIRSRKIVFPIHEHQWNKNKYMLSLLANLTEIKPLLILSSDSLRTPEQKAKACSSDNTSKYSGNESITNRDLLRKYLNSVTEVVGRGGIVLIAPQAKRSDGLYVASEKPIRPIINSLDQHCINKAAFMFIGIGKKDEADYGVEGLNLRKIYTVNIGPTYTKDELKKITNGKNQLIDDAVIFQLGLVVPPSYNKL